MVALGGSGIGVCDPRYAPLMPGSAWLILPTFNEAENLEAVVARRASRARRRPRPTGTGSSSSTTTRPTAPGAIADALAAEHDDVEVLHRPGARASGPAYLAGFARALDGGAGYVFEMDADLSHDPADLARLLAAVRDDGADLVLGSRYVPGGGVADWGVAAARRQPRRLAGTRGASSACSVARPHRRLQVLPRARCCAAIDLAQRRARAATPSRSS